ncbi:MAG: hypothetical protein ABEI86_06120 [Halobacteriaceae archaeon]
MNEFSRSPSGTTKKNDSVVDYNSTTGDEAIQPGVTDRPSEDVMEEGQTIDSPSDVQAALKKQLYQTSTLIFLLDCDRIMNPEEFSSNDHVEGKQDKVVDDTSENDSDLAIQEMEEIVSDVKPDDVILVASKADYLIDRFKEAKPHDYAPHEPGADYAEFTEFVTEGFRNNRHFQRLMNTTGADTIHPVYFETEERNGQNVPRVAENNLLPEAGGNDLQPVGFERVINQIKRSLK